MSQFAWFGTGSCVVWMVCGRSSGLEQLQQVVGEADDLPFRCGFFPAPQQEAPQSPPFFDLSKYRLYYLRVPGSNPSVSLRFRDLYGPVIALPCALRGCTAVLELLATSARAIIIAADPGRRARRRGLPGGAAQEKIDVREIFGLVRFYTDDYLPVVFFTKRDDLFAFGHRPHANYRRPFIGSQLRHSGFSLRVSNSSLPACPRFRNLHGQP